MAEQRTMQPQIRLAQETWDNERFNQNPVPSLLVGDLITVRDALGGWNNFVERYPKAAYDFARRTEVPALARAFLDKYANSRDLRFMEMCKEMRGLLDITPFRNFVYYGSTLPEDQDSLGLDWVKSNSWDDLISASEAE